MRGLGLGGCFGVDSVLLVPDFLKGMTTMVPKLVQKPEIAISSWQCNFFNPHLLPNVQHGI